MCIYTYTHMSKTHDGTFLEKRARRHCFTWFNYTNEDINRCKELVCDYITFGYEVCPESGKPHLQGYIEWEEGISGRQCLRRLLGTTDITGNSICGSAARKSRTANIKYCQKSETKDMSQPPPYFYERITKEKLQGKRTDCVFADVLCTMQETGQFLDILENYPDIAIKHHNGIDRCLNALNDRKALEARKAKFSSWIPYVWQDRLIKELSSPPNDRKIIWIWDEVGNKGKSVLCNWL